MYLKVLFTEANHIFKDRLTKYEDKEKFERIIHEIFTDNHLKFKYEGDIMLRNILPNHSTLRISTS